MEGAFEAMGKGEVDINWAKEHHDVWLAEQMEKRNARQSAPAE
jgi:formate dehydrogenase subunit gamma